MSCQLQPSSEEFWSAESDVTRLARTLCCLCWTFGCPCLCPCPCTFYAAPDNPWRIGDLEGPWNSARWRRRRGGEVAQGSRGVQPYYSLYVTSVKKFGGLVTAIASRLRPAAPLCGGVISSHLVLTSEAIPKIDPLASRVTRGDAFFKLYAASSAPTA